MRSLTGTLVHGIQVFRSLFRVGVRLVGNGLEQLEGVAGGGCQVLFAVTGVVMVTMVSIMTGVFLFFGLKKAACTSQC